MPNHRSTSSSPLHEIILGISMNTFYPQKYFTDTIRFVLITSSKAMSHISSHAVSSLLLELACENDGQSQVEESLVTASPSTDVSRFLISREKPEQHGTADVTISPEDALLELLHFDLCWPILQTSSNICDIELVDDNQ